MVNNQKPIRLLFTDHANWGTAYTVGGEFEQESVPGAYEIVDKLHDTGSTDDPLPPDVDLSTIDAIIGHCYYTSSNDKFVRLAEQINEFKSGGGEWNGALILKSMERDGASYRGNDLLENAYWAERGPNFEFVIKCLEDHLGRDLASTLLEYIEPVEKLPGPYELLAEAGVRVNLEVDRPEWYTENDKIPPNPSRADLWIWNMDELIEGSNSYHYHLHPFMQGVKMTLDMDSVKNNPAVVEVDTRQYGKPEITIKKGDQLHHISVEQHYPSGHDWMEEKDGATKVPYAQYKLRLGEK
ncbi:MAG: hypothetical protein ABIC95_03365 [archaeon]